MFPFFFITIKCIIGEEVLAVPKKRFIFQTQLASIFLSHIIYFAKYWDDLDFIIDFTMCLQIRTYIVLLELIKQYDIWCGCELVDRIFHGNL